MVEAAGLNANGADAGAAGDWIDVRAGDLSSTGARRYQLDSRANGRGVEVLDRKGVTRSNPF